MEILKEIQSEIQRLESAFISALEEMVKIPSLLKEDTSPYPFGEPINQALVKALDICEELGFKTYYDPEGYYGYAEVGQGEELLGILGHLDVVPQGREEDWHTPPFQPVTKEGRIYGRGTQDDKGPTLAAIFAIKALMNLDVDFKKRIRIIFGTDEETLWRCMEQYREKEELPTMGFTPDSTFPLVFAEKGLLQLTLKGSNQPGLHLQGGDAFNAVPSSITYDGEKQEEIKQKLTELGYPYEEQKDSIVVLGKPAHAQIPEEGINAIARLAISMYEVGIHSKLIDFIYALIKEDVYASSIFGDVHDEVSGKLKFNMGKIDISSDEILFVDIRIPVTANKNEIVEKLCQAAHKYGLEYEEFDYLPSIYVPTSSALVKTLMEVYQETTGDTISQPISSGGATYARAIRNCVAFGAIFPDQEKVEHQPNEYIELEKILQAMEIYAKAVFRLTR